MNEVMVVSIIKRGGSKNVLKYRMKYNQDKRFSKRVVWVDKASGTMQSVIESKHEWHGHSVSDVER